MQTLIRLTLVLILTAASGLLRAEEKKPTFDPAARASFIAPYIDEQTFAVAHVDISRFAADPLLALAGQLIPAVQDSPDLQRAKTASTEMLATLTKAGAKDVYFVFGLADVGFGRDPQPVFAIVPLAPNADVKALSAVLAPMGEVAERLDGVLFAGSRAALARLKQKSPPDDRPALTAAFSAAGDSAAQIVFAPPRYWQRVIEEMMPTMPSEMGSGPSTIFTHGIRWAALGVEPPLQFSARLVIQSQDADAAKALRQKWDELAGLIGKSDDVRHSVPNFAALQEILTPKVESDRLVIEVGQKQGLAGMISLLLPAVDNARTSAKRAESQNALRQLSMAMFMYARDHQKRLPAYAIYDANGKPILSWRVSLLPYLGQESLYKQFHLDEPWDSEHNSKLIAQMPALYRWPGSKLAEPGRTNFLVPFGKETLFPPAAEGMLLKDVENGSSLITIVEADDKRAVVWTEPDDLPFDTDIHSSSLAGLYEGGFNAAFADGHVEFVSIAAGSEKLRALFLRRPDKTAPKAGGAGQKELLKKYPGKVALPDELYQTYADLVAAFESGKADDIQKYCLPGKIKITTDPRPKERLEYGKPMEINLPFLKSVFDKYILVLEDNNGEFLIRTTSTGLWFTKQNDGTWKLSKYSDDPIE